MCPCTELAGNKKKSVSQRCSRDNATKKKLGLKQWLFRHDRVTWLPMHLYPTKTFWILAGGGGRECEIKISSGAFTKLPSSSNPSLWLCQVHKHSGYSLTPKLETISLINTRQLGNLKPKLQEVLLFAEAKIMLI